jgi:hypothetical protein
MHLGANPIGVIRTPPGVDGPERVPDYLQSGLFA